MDKESFCYLCPYIDSYPPSFFDPGYAECPGDFEPDSEFCPRHKEWLEEMEGEEDEY
mgnify:FL=1